MVWVCVCQIYFHNSMNYTKLSVTCLDPFHHIYTVHYLSMKPPKIKFTSNISSRWCHCWFPSWFIEAWIITSVKQCTLSTIQLVFPIIGFWNEKKGNVFCMYSNIYTKQDSKMWNAKRQRFKEGKGSKVCSFALLENIHSFIHFQ